MVNYKSLILRWTRHNKSYYKKLGIEFTNEGDLFELDISKLPQYSKVFMFARCDLCGRPFEIKTGRFGKFLACTGYPECKTIKAIPKDTKRASKTSGKSKTAAASKAKKSTVAAEGVKKTKSTAKKTAAKKTATKTAAKSSAKKTTGTKTGKK